MPLTHLGYAKSPMHSLTPGSVPISRWICSRYGGSSGAMLFSIAVIHSCYSDRSAVTGFTTAALRDGK